MPLGTPELMLIEQRVANDAPSTGVAYLLWFFLWWAGGHRWYLGRSGTAILMIIATVCGILPGAIWALIDGFLIPGMIRQKKDAIRLKVTQELTRNG